MVPLFYSEKDTDASDRADHPHTGRWSFDPNQNAEWIVPINGWSDLKWEQIPEFSPGAAAR